MNDMTADSNDDHDRNDDDDYNDNDDDENYGNNDEDDYSNSFCTCSLIQAIVQKDKENTI